eukprot:gnl/MRDRNA2_/MRDRNA2_92757_c0_seq1.p1 gnl/MRDRNA2_/MRDRNA2_92757_c0~~gnl/MRDRNA2_/MRDRNA2_92757_c0_seq1.p1  ORF type:complete len:151 (+),score=44.06 gnl/MRDRNA2_/MRDRNA2_92757_c0_seq1:77-529(+)
MKMPTLPCILGKASHKYAALAADETPTASPSKRGRQVHFEEQQLPAEKGSHSAKRQVRWQVRVGEGARERDVTVQAEKTPNGSRRVFINGGLMHEENDGPLSFGFELTEPNAFMVKEHCGQIQLSIDNVPLEGWSAWTPKARSESAQSFA